MPNNSQGGLRGDPVLRRGWDDGTRDQMCKRINELEAARDHLRARLHQQIEDWNAKSQAYDVRRLSADVSDNREGAWRLEAMSEAFENCAADLLAVLTEQLQETKDDQSRVDGECQPDQPLTASEHQATPATVTRRRVAAVRAFNELSGPEAQALVAGLEDVRAGRVRSLADIDREIANGTKQAPDFPYAIERKDPADTCGGCGGPYLFDTTIPSDTWNRVVRPLGISEYLCVGCIVRIFAERGESFTAELWSSRGIDAFNGLPITLNVGHQQQRGLRGDQGARNGECDGTRDQKCSLRNHLAVLTEPTQAEKVTAE